MNDNWTESGLSLLFSFTFYGKIYSERTGQSLKKISRDLDRDQFLSAKEAKEYGIVDQVAADYKW